MWLMPSYGRPQALRKLLEAPGGWPKDVWVLVNEDDPELTRYKQVQDSLILAGITPPWWLFEVPKGSRFADAVRYAHECHPDQPFYGIIDDDYWPITPGWHERMVAAAGPNAIAIANNRVNFPSVYTCRVMGGELARAIGTIAPGKMRHNYSDDAWGRFASDFGLLRPLEDVIVEHRHHLFTEGVKKDATYERGSGDFGDDKARYQDWLNSEERREQCERVAKLLGIKIAITDLRKVKLAICIPMQNMSVDWAFHRSFHATMKLLADHGVSCTISETAGGSHIGKAREKALWQAVRMMPDYTHLFWLDDDMGWDPRLILRLICSDHDFSAVAGAKKTDTVSLCFNPLSGPPRFDETTKFLEVRHVGFAFVCLKRGVIERMCESYPELRYNTGAQPPEWALFLDMIKTGDGFYAERLSEDFSFCQRWRDIGGRIFIDPDSPIIHAGRKEYTGRPRDGMADGAWKKPEEMPRAAA